jgi:uncharacterized repeat protein (TIGR01451 family)
MKKILLICLFFISLKGVYGQISAMNIIGPSTITTCDSILNFSVYNVQAPANPSGDFNLIASNINTGSYALVFSVDWGDGTTSTYQGTGNPLNVGSIISFNPPMQHTYSVDGTYTVVLVYTSTNGGPAGSLTFNYTRISCGTMLIPTTGASSVLCGANVMLHDAGGPNGNYNSNSSGYTILTNSGSSQITISGNYTYLETTFDTLKIFAGSGIGGQLLYAYNGSSGGSITPFTSQPGQPITVQLVSDATVVGAGFSLQVQYTGSCAPISAMIYAIAQVDCNNDGTIDSTLTNGVPMIVYSTSNSYTGITQNGSFMLQNISAGNYSVAVDPNWLNANGYILNSINPSMLSITSGGAYTFALSLGCATSSSLQCLSGTIYYDLNGNGAWDNGENVVSNAAVNINYNGQNYLTYSNTSGNYSITYNGNTGDSVWIGLNSNWLNSIGCSPTFTPGLYVLSAPCTPGMPPASINLGVNCGSNLPNNCYSGYVFCDANGNGIMNAGELPIPFAPVYLGVSPNSNSSITVYTDSTGYFSYCGQIGTSNTAIAWLNSRWLAYQGYTANSSLITLVGSATGNNQPGFFAVNCGGISCTDLWTTVTPWIGYYQNTTAQIKLSWGNYGPISAGNYQLTLTYPIGVTVNLASIQNSGYTISGNTITWNLANLNATFTNHDFISFQLPSGLINGAQHYFTSTISPINSTDCNLVNNSSSLLQILGNSYDPNDKTVQRSDFYTTTPISMGAEILDANQQDVLTYTIRFQNTGTAPAQNVYILDTLSSNLNWSTFSLINATHPVQVVHQPNGLVRFEFNQIWLADSTTNEPESHGSLVYRITEKSTCLAGCEIKNTAYIYFDWNEAIITNTTYNVNESINGIDQDETNDWVLYPNPAKNSIQIRGLETFKYEIYDFAGKLLLHGEGTENEKLDIRELMTGAYILTIKSENENVRVVRFVKN